MCAIIDVCQNGGECFFGGLLVLLRKNDAKPNAEAQRPTQATWLACAVDGGVELLVGDIRLFYSTKPEEQVKLML